MKKYILIIFALLLLVGLTGTISSMFVNISGSVGNLPDSVLTMDEADYNKDGKGIVWNRSLDSGTWINTDGTLTSNIGFAGLRNGSIRNDALEQALVYYVDDSMTNVVSGDSYIVIGPEIELSKYGVVMFDVDVSVDNAFDWQIGLRPDFVDANRENSAKSAGAIRYVDGHIRNIDGSMLMENVGESFHYTFIFYNEGDDCNKGCNNGRILVYVNGELLCVREPATMFYDDIQYFRGFRAHIVSSYGLLADASFSLSNLKVSVFSPEYEGAIYDLLENPHILLKNNSDTLLYQK